MNSRLMRLWKIVNKIFVNNGPTICITKSQASRKQDKTARGKAFKQILAALTVNFATINTGMALGFSAVALPQLQANSSDIPVTEDQASWIGIY
ncbi:hypothetical protein EVAR_102851_1 [Eumeta japonica]|uniref:Uncharacterized protein n=1 Tax=Eumeta variegata TaxID=151549 RepID=A0A4C1UMP9_EUMVA|nr:hypothetical protein EVAR_102851_1 [Eumeta japonica]